MPITSQIDPVRNLTTFKVNGPLQFDEVMAAVRSFYAGEPTVNVLWDLNDISEISVTSDEVAAIVNYQPRYEGKRQEGKTAMVSRKDVVYGLSRMFQIQSELKDIPNPVRVFHSMEEAYKWLEES